MASDLGTNRRLTRLENDTESIYELLAAIGTTQTEHSHRLDGVETRLTELGTTLDEHTRQLEAVETRLDGIDTRLDGIDTRLDGIDTRLDGVETRLDGVETTLIGIGSTLEDHSRRFEGMEGTLAEIVRRLPAPS